MVFVACITGAEPLALPFLLNPQAFLNLHAYTYVRLDGATKPEQRQILTQRFNSDPKIFCFILSTRRWVAVNPLPAWPGLVWVV